MKKIIIFSVVGVICFLNLILAQENDHIEDEWDYLTASQGEPLTTRETLQLLQRLNHTYSFQSDTKSNSRKQLIGDLIETSNVIESKCNDGKSIDQIDELIVNSSTYSLNILPYLMRCKARQQRLCELMSTDNDENVMNFENYYPNQIRREQDDNENNRLILEEGENESVSPSDPDVSKLDRKIMPERCEIFKSKIFSVNLPKLGVSEILDLMNQLPELQIECSEYWLMEERILFTNLRAKCSQNEMITCETSTFYWIDMMLKKYSNLHNAIEPLLLHCRQKREDFCIQKKLKEMLNHIKSRLPDSIREKLKVLKSKVVGEKLNPISESSVTKGLVDYLKSQDNLVVSEDLKNFTSYFEHMFISQGGLCYEISLIEPDQDLMMTLKYDSYLMSKFDPQARDILMQISICNVVLNNHLEIVPKVYSLLN